MPPDVAIALYYFCYLGAIGVFLPFVSLYLASVGLTPAQVTRAMALGPAAGLLVPPLVGLMADWRRARIWLLRGATAATLVASLGFLAERPGAILPYVVMAAFACARAPLLSLVDASALDVVARSGGVYGRLRLWGSLGFLVAVVIGGFVEERVGPVRVMAGVTAGLALSIVVAFALPAPRPTARPQIFVAWRRLLADRTLRRFLVAGALWYAANAAYDSGFSLHLQRLGFGGRFVGVAWAVGVAAEVALLAVSGRVLARIGAERLFVVGMATAAARWLLLGWLRAGWAILLSQPLHGVTFGLSYAAAVHLARERGHEAPTAAQGLFAASMMVGSIAGMAVAGRILEALGGAGLFGAAGLVAAAGCGCAVSFARASRLETGVRSAA